EGELLEVIGEESHDDGSANVTLRAHRGRISTDLTVGANVAGTVELQSNNGLANRGVCLFGSGFIITTDKAKELGLGTIQGIEEHIRHYRNGKDITDEPRDVMVIDLFGMSAEEVRQKFPAVYQHIFTHVKPERDQNKRAVRRVNWWIFGEPNKELRRMLAGLPRYIVTLATSKHRVFTFLGEEILPDDCLVSIALQDAFHLGVLSSRIHVTFALAAGGRLGVGNDPRYNKTRCFDPFPFPLCDEAQKARIRALAEELDAHRKRVQAQHGLTLTGLYNVLEKLRASQPLNAKDKDIHDKGLVSILKQLHDDLDAAVFAAYGWPPTLTDAEILERLVALNAQRTAEEKQGIIHWLRQEYQNPQGQATSTQSTLDLPAKKAAGKSPKGKVKTAAVKVAWPKPLAERIRATEQALHAAGRAVSAEELTLQFLRAKPGDVQEILESLVALGRAHRSGDAFSV
ncbi:MAG: type IIL restriction-modification enzyme MmeI, partial [Prosthecobacter sp.]|nr:type IIL restriction-modification enzyme MmeI [Prosthecobacter sp.]